jgi:hypothetical protein
MNAGETETSATDGGVLSFETLMCSLLLMFPALSENETSSE